MNMGWQPGMGIVIIFAGMLFAEVNVRVGGPQSAHMGDEVTYQLHISNSGEKPLEMLMLYCYIPKELSYVVCKSAKNNIQACYSEDFNRVYAEKYGFMCGEIMNLSVTFKVAAELWEQECREIPFYFTFLVVEDGQEKEFSKKKVLKIMKKAALCEVG